MNDVHFQHIATMSHTKQASLNSIELSRIPDFRGQTDGQTDIHMDGQTDGGQIYSPI